MVSVWLYLLFWYLILEVRAIRQGSLQDGQEGLYLCDMILKSPWNNCYRNGWRNYHFVEKYFSDKSSWQSLTFNVLSYTISLQIYPLLINYPSLKRTEVVLQAKYLTHWIRPMEIEISFLSLLYFSRVCRLKRHSQKTQWEWRHFKLTC